MRCPFTNAELERLLAIEAEAGFARAPIEIVGLGPGEKRREELTTKRLRRGVEQGAAEATLDLLVAAVPEFEASDEAWTWARRRSAPVVPRSGLPRSA